MVPEMKMRIGLTWLALCLVLGISSVADADPLGRGEGEDGSLEELVMTPTVGALGAKSVPGARVLKRNPRKVKVTKVVSEPEIKQDDDEDQKIVADVARVPREPFTFVAPVKRRRVTSKYGHRRHPKTRRRHLHKGTDYGGKKGTRVLSTGPGKVVHAGWGRNRNNGIFVIVEHPGGWESYYLHLSKVDVKEGDIVKPSQLVGRIGNTGRSTGPHLHFQLQRKGHTVNPEKVIGRRSDRVRPSH